MSYDPTFYGGAAPYYLPGRPPYSSSLFDVVARELQWDGTGHLLDVGCGPGVLAVLFAQGFDRVIGLDPDPAMLDEARRHAANRGVTNVSWVQAVAEDGPSLGLPALRAATFGQSFHWTDRDVVSEAIYDLLVPGGAIVLIAPDIDAGPAPQGPGDPPIPHDEINEIIRRYLGPERRAGRGLAKLQPERYEDALKRTRFGAPRVLHTPGQADLVRDVDGVIAGYLSMSYAAPHLFGARLDDFVGELGDLLSTRTPTGKFWDWPGDTAVLIGLKP